MVQSFVHVIKYFMSKCIYSANNQFMGGGAPSLSDYSQINPLGGLNVGGRDANAAMEGTVFSSSSMTMTEHMMDRSFDDDRRNMFEQVKSLLLSKLMTIQ